MYNKIRHDSLSFYIDMEEMKMPTLTFYNLKEEKQKKITVAIENELDRVPLEKISINKIIVDASIPRGSFYQYFKDVEDAVQYVVEKYIEDEKRAIKEILSKNNNDIFRDTLELYDYLVDKYYNLKEVRLYANIFSFLHQKNYPLRNSGERSQEEINKMFELDYLNIRTKEDIELIAKILAMVMRGMVLEVFSKRLSKEEGHKQLEQQIEILKNGMLKRKGQK